MDRIVAISSRLVVMAEKARELLQKVYDVPHREDRSVIHHGIPRGRPAFMESRKRQRRASALPGRGCHPHASVFFPRTKGIEYVIDAMPAVALRSRPDAVYVVLGATHPNLSCT